MIDQGPTKCQSLLSYLSDFMDGELSPDLCEQIGCESGAGASEAGHAGRDPRAPSVAPRAIL